MKTLISSFILLCALSISLSAQSNLRSNVTELVFTTSNGDTPFDAQAKYIIRYYVNNEVKLLPVLCSGEVKPWTCSSPLPQLSIGNNIIYVTSQSVDLGSQEGPKSNPLIIFYAVNQRDFVINSEVVSKCAPGTFEVSRITDATKLLGILNSISKHVNNVVATSNAIYVISCGLL